ncbi:C-type lectin 37Da-like [Drosophila bipectinata]|uniref:C-type lectin 37Da-like n=1 Tax=Drosophila bipectinata TaxID=42026 RepID=UPI001C89A240|nr:C-type lectin 37Da-like [Drosophila bipectinata]
MLKATVLFTFLLASAKIGWTYEEFTYRIDEGNLIGAKLNTEPFIPIYNGYYYFGRESLNWYEAYEKCRQFNSELVTFETDEEFDAVSNYLMSGEGRGNFWTSGNDLAQRASHRWFTSGEKINSQRWAPNQPDNHSQIENCVHMGFISPYSERYELNDRPCSHDSNSLFKYICEAPKIQTISIVVWK